MSPGRLMSAGADIGGAGWYRRARASVESYLASEAFGPLYRPTLSVACDVLAITSPRVRVARNVELTRAYLEGPGEGVYPSGLLPATRAALAHWEATGEVRGPKTEAFARALVGDPDALVLDTHVFQAYGHPPGRIPRAEVRRSIERSLRCLARRRGLTPAEGQAALWCGWLAFSGTSPPELAMLGGA